MGILQTDILNAYSTLQRRPREPSAGEWVSIAEMTRFDPRLGEILIENIRDYFYQINPIELNSLIHSHLRIPASIGPLLEHVEIMLPGADRKKFTYWKNLVLENVEIASYQNYFVGLTPFGHESLLRIAASPNPLYSKWGFYADDLMINKATQWLQKNPQTLLSADERKKRLDQMIRSTERIRTDDYISFLGHMVSRRQAQLDLSRHPRLCRQGNTKAAFWVIKTIS
jgi:hypothetical protein